MKRNGKSPSMIEIIEQGYESLHGLCVKCGTWRTMRLDHLTVTPGPIDLEKLTLATLIERVRCKKCGGEMQDDSFNAHGGLPIIQLGGSILRGMNP